MDLKIIFLTVVLEEKKVIQKKRGSGWRWFDTSRSGTLNEYEANCEETTSNLKTATKNLRYFPLNAAIFPNGKSIKL